MASEELHAYDVADELAALNRMRLIQELEPEFYQRHWQRVTYITAVVSGFAQDTDDLRLAMGICASSPEDDAAEMIRELFPNTSFADEKSEWFLRQLETVLRSALKLVREPDLPDWLHHTRDVIEHAFVSAPPDQGTT
jgi:hypothetical protein